MNKIIAESFINQYSIDKRVTVFDIEEHFVKGLPHLSGSIQSDDLLAKFRIFYREHSEKFTDSICTIDGNSLTTKGIIRVSLADLHKEPSFTSPVVTQALLGTIVTIVKFCNDWVLIQLPDGYLGWVSETIVPADETSCIQWDDSNLIVIVAQHGFVYKDINETSIVSDSMLGNRFISADESSTHYKVIYPDLRTGFIRKESAQPLNVWKSEMRLTRENVVESAQLFNGIPYVWGGISSRGLDCSGFTKLVYSLNGFELPRDADQQAYCGTPVEYDKTMSKVMAGDLLFFGRRPDGSVDKRADSQIPISHVGLSLGGKSYMQASGDIHVSSFEPDDSNFDKRRAESLQMIRRII